MADKIVGFKAIDTLLDVKHRHEVVVRRTQFDLIKLKKETHSGRFVDCG